MANINIKQVDLLQYLVDKFNANSFGIPFRMGTYDGDNEHGLTIYAPARDNNGKFDQTDVFDEDTYQISKKSFVVMDGMANSGEYVALPNVHLVNFDVTLEFLVYVDSPVSEIIRMAIEEVRDGLIGNLDTMTVNELDFDDGDGTPTEQVLRVVTTADSIDYGQLMTIKKRNYLNYSLSVSMSVSKTIDFGNQVKWYFLKKLAEEDCVEPTETASEENFGDTVVADDQSSWESVITSYSWEESLESLEEPYDEEEDFVDNLETPTEDGLTAKVGGQLLSKAWVYVGYDQTQLDPVDYNGITGTHITMESALAQLEEDHPASGEDVGATAREEENQDPYGYFYFIVEGTYEPITYYISVIDGYEWEFVSVPSEQHEIIPLIASWSTNQDQESFQTLRPFATTTEVIKARAKEVHNYVKNRGFGTVFTFLLDSSQYMVKELFKETFQKLDKPNIYEIEMIMKVYDSTTEAFIDSTDLTFSRTMIFGEAESGDIVYGEPIVFAIGFTPSAKDV